MPIVADESKSRTHSLATRTIPSALTHLRRARSHDGASARVTQASWCLWVDPMPESKGPTTLIESIRSPPARVTHTGSRPSP